MFQSLHFVNSPKINTENTTSDIWSGILQIYKGIQYIVNSDDCESYEL